MINLKKRPHLRKNHLSEKFDDYTTAIQIYYAISKLIKHRTKNAKKRGTKSSNVDEKKLFFIAPLGVFFVFRTSSRH